MRVMAVTQAVRGMRGRLLAIVGALAVAAGLTTYIVLREITATGADAQAGLDSAAATIGALLAYLLLGRFWEHRRVRDLFLSGFLLLAAASNAIFSAAPRALGDAVDPGASAVAGVLAGVAFLGATWLPGVVWPWRPRYAVMLLSVVVRLALLLSAVVGISGGSSGSVDSFGATPDFTPSLLQLVAALLFAAGALGAARRSGEDALMV